MPHPFRVFLRNGWDTDKIPVYTISEKALSKLPCTHFWEDGASQSFWRKASPQLAPPEVACPYHSGAKHRVLQDDGSGQDFRAAPRRPDLHRWHHHKQQDRPEGRLCCLWLLRFRSHKEYRSRFRKKIRTGYSIAITVNQVSFHSSTWVRRIAKPARCTDKRRAVSAQNCHFLKNWRL